MDEYKDEHLAKIQSLISISGLHLLGFFADGFCLPSKIGEEQSAEDAEDGPPELLVSPSY